MGDMMRKLITHPALRNLLFVLLLSGIASGLGYLATRYHVQRDITHNTSNSLEPASVEVLSQLSGPVNITVYATEQDARLGDIRKLIRNYLSLYQRYKPDMRLVFIDPEKEPEKTRAARVQLNGEMVVEYAGRSEHLTQLNEQTLTGTLLRVAHSREQTVMYLDGHGERKLDGIANHDLLNPFGAKLKQNGFRGGSLIWLVDAGPLHGLERLAEKLDLLLPAGIVIDPAAAGMNAPVTWSLGAAYPPHAVTRNFNLITAFPSARPLSWNENPDWQHSVLVEVAARGWVSRTAPDATPRFDKRHDTPGPAIIAVALQRNINDREQRIVVVGNGAFLANSFAGNGGNVDLGVNMVNWLASEEHLITLQPRAAKDSSLTLGKAQLTAIGIGFLLGLPLLLAGVGIRIWWKRRRA